MKAYLTLESTMKSKAIVCAITVASLGFGSLSFAQGFDQRGPGAQPSRVEQPSPMQQRYGRDAGPRHVAQRDMRNERRFDTRGSQFHRGDRIPTEYRNRQYAMNNWHAQHLNAPARGQQWVQVGADYALIAIATGVIAQLVLSR